MIHPRVMAVVLVLLALCISSSVLADNIETIVDLSSSGWYKCDGICTYDRESVWSWAAGGSYIEKLTNACPSGSTDPRIRQTILNQTNDTWTDWHVKVLGGSNLRDISVIKTYDVGSQTNPNIPWTIVILNCSDGVEFMAHLETTGNPNNPAAVRNGDKLYVDFSYDALSGSAQVIQYPTTNWAIPEPSSIMALIAGISCVGLGSLKRRGRK
ncbi:MAG: PEP-CTERM sorting domain-containing protein [Armatimonadota bacterium]|nr:PEP-CTERM sorting domain-containing protein [bacterium]